MPTIAGFSDSIVVRTYNGSSRNVDPMGDPCFKIPRPDWYEYAKVSITADQKGDLEWIKERLASSGEIESDGVFLYIYPAEMLDWFNPEEYGRYTFTLYRRVASAQEFAPQNLKQFNLQSLIDQENTNVRLAQEAMEMARRGLHFPPGEFSDFSGEETIVPESAIPPVNIRRGRLLGFHPTTGAPALFDATGYIGDPGSVDVVVPKAELQGQQFFKYDTAGVVKEPTVVWTVSVYGFVPDTYTWYVKTGATWDLIVGETLNQITLLDNDYPELCTIKVVAMNASFFAEDSASLVKLRDGSGAYTVIIDNQVMPVQCDPSGAPVSGELGPSSDANFSVYVYKGTTELAPVTGVPSIGQFRIENIAGGTSYIKPISSRKFYLDDAGAPRVINFDVNCESLSTIPKAVSWAKAKEGLQGAAGDDGSAGIDARSVSVTSDAGAVVYDSNNNRVSPSTITLTAATRNTVGTVYYEFFKNDASMGAASTSNTKAIPPAEFDVFSETPMKIEVQIREGSAVSPILARDQMTIVGVKPGANAITILIPNDNHTCPVNAGVVDYTSSGTEVKVWDGTTQLTVDNSNPYANGTFRVSVSSTTLTPGSLTQVDGQSQVTIGNHSAMTQDVCQVTVTITTKSLTGVETVFTRYISVVKSLQGLNAPNIQVRYSLVDGTPWTASATTGKYMQTSSDGGTTWSGSIKINSVDGTPGLNGYVHTKYSDDGGVTFTASSGEAPGSWLGQYTDNTAADSNSPAAYSWSKILGSSGIYPSDTALSFRLPLDDMPELPDNVAGIAYQNDATWSGWTGGNATVSVSSGVIRAVSTSTVFSLISNHGPIAIYAPFVFVRLRVLKGGLSNYLFYYKSSGNASFRSIQINPTMEWETYVIKPNDLSSDYMTAWEIDMSSASVGDCFEIDVMQVGDGTYKSTTSAQDTSSSLLKLSYQPGATRISGPFGFAIDVAYGGLLSSVEDGLPMYGSPRSGGIYFKTGDTDTGYQQLIAYGLVSGTSFFGVYHQGSVFGIENGTSVVSFSDSGLRNNAWHLLSWTYDGTSISIFIDAVQKASGTLALSTTPSIGLNIGHRSGSLRFRGQLKPMPIWSRALSAAEVLGLYAQTPAPDAKIVEVAIARDIGYENYEAMVSQAKSGKTVIKGGYINTDLIKTGGIYSKNYSEFPGTPGVAKSRSEFFLGDESTDKPHIKMRWKNSSNEQFEIEMSQDRGFRVSKDPDGSNTPMFRVDPTSGAIILGDRYDSSGNAVNLNKDGMFLPVTGIAKVSGLQFEGSRAGGIQWGTALIETSQSFPNSFVSVAKISSYNSFYLVFDSTASGIVVYSHNWNGSGISSATIGSISGNLAYAATCAMPGKFVPGNPDVYFVLINCATDTLSLYKANIQTNVITQLMVTSAVLLSPSYAICPIGEDSTNQYFIVESGSSSVGGGRLGVIGINKTTNAYSSAYGLNVVVNASTADEAPALTQMENLVFCHFDRSSGKVQRFTVSSDFLTITPSGGDLFIGTNTNKFTSISSLNSSDIAIVHNDSMSIVRWSGSEWVAVTSTSGVQINSGAYPCINSLDGSSVMIYDSLADTMRMVRYGFSLSVPLSP